MIDRLTREDINVVEASTLVSVHAFRLADIPHPKIIVTIWKDAEPHGGHGFYRYEASHAIHAPGQADAYYPSSPYADSEQAALQRAIRDFTFYYESAKSRGYTPNPRWIVPRNRRDD